MKFSMYNLIVNSSHSLRPLCLQDTLWSKRLSLNLGKSGAAGTKSGQLLEVKDERYKQSAILK